MMNVAIEYEFLKKQKKPIPNELWKKLDKVFDWLDNLSSEEYAKLIR